MGLQAQFWVERVSDKKIMLFKIIQKYTCKKIIQKYMLFKSKDQNWVYDNFLGTKNIIKIK
jgi:hypothetical protein